MIIPLLASDSENEIRTILNEMLSRDEFKRKKADTSFIRELFDKIIKFFEKYIDAFFRWLGRLLGRLFGKLDFNFDSSISSGSKRLIGIIIILLIIALAIFTVFLILKTIKTKREKRLSEKLGDELEEYASKPDEPMVLVNKFKENGQYRQAYRYLFIAMLIMYNTKGYMIVHKSKTNRMYIDEIREQSERLYNDSIPFFKFFDMCWYGKRDIPLSILEDWISRYNKISNIDYSAEGEDKTNEA